MSDGLPQMPEDSSERRTSPRVGRHLTVRYRRATENAWRVGALRDVSRDGARMTSELTLKPQELLLLELGLPIFHQPMQISARVVWEKTVASGGLTWQECGLLFTSLTDEAKKTLDGAIQRFLSHAPPRR